MVIQDVPLDLGKLISRCLCKAPERRFQHMKDLKVELEELNEESDSGTPAGAPILSRCGKRPPAVSAVNPPGGFR